MTAHEASSSSSSNSKLWKYDVFLSFRGEDTRYGFTNHLHAALEARGYRVFIDEDDLQRGEEIKEKLFRAIEESRISVIIFSKMYADSSWCLDELVKIMECRDELGRHVLPIFYHVDPSHVRKQDRDLAEAFQKHEKDISEEKDDNKRKAGHEGLKLWREALRKAANLSGHHLKNANDGPEAEFIKKIIDENICEWLTSTNELHVAKHIVGINSRIQDIISYLSSGGSNDVLMVGIWGMGGLGKTTAAKAIYNQVHPQFEFKSFLADVRDATSKRDLVNLQKELINDILKNKPEISCVAKGISLIKQEFQHRKILVIVDNIDKVEQLDAIVGSHDWFGPGSRIIITTRDERLLLNVDRACQAKKMNEEEALELFSWHAFKNSCPDQRYLEVSDKVVSYCGGLPLALEVLGSLLIKRSFVEWESQLEKLRRYPDGNIVNQLRTSYEGLDSLEKAIFLDISCFFIGEDKDYVAKRLDRCGFYATIGINVLRERCLITVERNKLNMHDLLREMARVIISEKSLGHPGKWSRLWNRQEATEVLRNKTGTEEVEGLALNFPDPFLEIFGLLSFSTEAFGNMKKLRFLHLKYVQLNGEYKHLPKELIWLRWEGCPLKSIPDDFLDQPILVVLDMQWSQLVQVWEGYKLLERLKILNLGYSPSLIKSPDFSQVPNLEELILEDCWSLSEIHPSIGQLQKLSLANLKGCTELSSLPRDFYRLKSVETLLLSRCSKLREVHEDLGEMISLRILEAEDTTIRQIPSSTVRLKNLTLLHLEANDFHTLPSLSGLTKLETLRLNYCSYLRTIPDLPTNLKFLYADDCPRLETMPNFSEMSNMRELDVGNSPKLTDVPGLDKSLNFMTLIDMRNSTNLTADFGKNILQGWTSCGFGGILLYGNFVPVWFEFVNHGNTVSFDIPPNDGRTFEGLTLCFLHKCESEFESAIELGITVINNTKRTTLQAFLGSVYCDPPILWQGQLSNDKLKLQSGDKVEVQFSGESHYYRPSIRTMVNLVWNKPMKESTHDLDQTSYVFDQHPARFYEESSDNYEPSNDYDLSHHIQPQTHSENLSVLWKYDMTAHEASSSSFSKSKLWKYDIFLSFRGEDTCNGFMSHLHMALKARGYRVFIDEDDLQRGEEIKEKLFRAIEESRISVIIFSKMYVDSSWCLDELVKIMECRDELGRDVLPIFYRVDRLHVRKQDGDLAEAFQKHEKDIREEKDDKKREAKQERLNLWREALTKAANLSGHHLKIANNGCEAEFIKKIIDENICEWLTSTNELHVAKHIVGINSRVQDIISYLSIGGSNDVLMVGIWGMGGLGKTTAAKAIYNQIHPQFEFKSFLADVRDVTSKHDLVDLQKKLISDILKKKHEIRCVGGGIKLIRQQFPPRKILVIVDNIDKQEQLDAIVGSHDWFGPGSRIIITTRDERLLHVNKTFQAKKMNEEEALELFSWHAFNNRCPNQGYLEVSKKVVSYCGGLPLALKVLGSLLIKRSLVEWESQLEKLGRYPVGNIVNQLRTSFEGLDSLEKAIFLNISCFFIGEDKDYVAKRLDRCGFYATIGINVLRERCLITVERNKLNMHGLLREMARVIISEKSLGHPGKWSRLWNRQDAVEVLRNKSGTEEVEGLALNFPDPWPRNYSLHNFSTEAFGNMKKLRFLHLKYVRLNGEYKHLPKELIWLCWEGFRLKSIPDDFFDQPRLVVLDMQYSNLVQVWEGKKLLERLKILNLSHSLSLIKSPDFSQVPNLEELILENCDSLSEIHPSICQLQKLSLVNLKQCKCLSYLPRDFYKLKSVEILLLNGCLEFREVHGDLGEMKSLRILEADYTAIRQIPSSTVRWKNLTLLSLKGVKLAHDAIPQDFGSLISLQVLDLQGNDFHTLPSLSGLTKLETLRLNDSFNLCAIPDLPTNLKFLYAANCPTLETMPNFSEMSNMIELKVSDSPKLTEVPGLDKSLNFMTLIDMSSCTNLTADFGKNILQGWTSCGFGGVLLYGNFVPDWFEFVNHGNTVSFDIPSDDGRTFEGLTLCFLHKYAFESSFEFGITVINNTKRTKLQAYLGSGYWDKPSNFNLWHILWQGQLRNDKLKLQSGDKVEVIVLQLARKSDYYRSSMRTMVNLVWNKPMKENTQDLDQACYVFWPTSSSVLWGVI